MFRWGIMGTGMISSKFAKGLEACTDMEVYATASLSGSNPFMIESKVQYDTYEALVQDEQVDAVYIGTIHTMHAACARIALEAGKPVLCEKPVTMNAKELESLLELAREKGVFFMEAMWSRYLPGVKKIRSMLASGMYGAPQTVHVDFGNKCPDFLKRLFDIRLGGGALLDVGVYGLNLAQYWLGCEPVKVHAWAEKTEDTVDLDTSVQLQMADDTLVDMNCSIKRCMNNAAHIVTEKAEFIVPYFWRPEKIYMTELNHAFVYDQNPVEISCPIEGNGYGYEAEEVRRCLKAGLLESPDMSWAESLQIMQLMDEIRRRCGIIYPQDFS